MELSYYYVSKKITMKIYCSMKYKYSSKGCKSRQTGKPILFLGRKV